MSNPSLSRSADYRKPTYIDSAGSGLCSVLITVGIGNVPGIESSNSMWRARWAVLVRDTPVWWSSGYDDLCITAQGTLVGKAEIPVRKLLEALPSDLTVGDILRLTDPNLDHGEVLEAIISRARNSGENNIGAEANGAEEHVEPAGITELESTYGMRLEVSLDHGKRISLPINMGVSTW